MTSFRSLLLIGLAGAALTMPAAWAATPDPAFAVLAAPAGARLVAMEESRPMRVVLTLPLHDQAGAQRYAAAVSEPGNALYGKFLTPAGFAAKFGADRATYEFLRHWAVSSGLTVGERTASRTTLSLGGTSGQFARLFATKFASFQTAAHGDGHVTLSPPVMPEALAGRVDGVIGLTSGGRYGFLARPRPAAAPDVGTGLGGGYAPADIRTAYRIPAQSSTAPGEIVGLFEQGGFSKADVTTYERQYRLPPVRLLPVGVNGSSTEPTSGVEVEAVLDVDAVLGINPAISKIIIYEDGNDPFSVALVDSMNQMAQDDLAKIISISYGTDEAMQGKPAIRAENTALFQLAIQGQTVFVSSGDQGAPGRAGTGLNAPDPGSQPLVTSVGGTRLNATRIGQTYVDEVVWNDLPLGDGATGGGVSAFWAIPYYQMFGGTSVALANGGSASMRNVPDLAADASPLTGYSIYVKDAGGWGSIGGTSLAAPLWAGMASIINAERVALGKSRLGFFNPLLYRLGAAGHGFHDVTSGDNGYLGEPSYAAGAGYDNCTGFGSVNLTTFLQTVLRSR